MAVTKGGLFGLLAGFGLSLLLFLVGFGVPKWYSGFTGIFPNDIISSYGGLWKECGSWQCRIHPNPPYSLKVIQGVMCLALLSVSAATAAYVIWLIAVLQGKSTKEGLYGLAAKLAGILVIVAGVFDLMGLFGFSMLLNMVPNGWTYWLAVVSTAGFLIIGPITIMLNRGKAEKGNDQGEA